MYSKYQEAQLRPPDDCVLIIWVDTALTIHSQNTPSSTSGVVFFQLYCLHLTEQTFVTTLSLLRTEAHVIQRLYVKYGIETICTERDL